MSIAVHAPVLTATHAPASTYSVLSRDDETSLMVAFQARRSTETFEALYRATAPGLLHWIEQLHLQGRLKGDPMDALQDTFVNVYRYAGSFRESAAGGFRAWARTIASNALRRARRRPRSLGVLFSELDEAVLPDPEDRAAGPARMAESRENTLDLRKAYALMLLQYAQAYRTLKPRDQEALAMVEVEGLNYAQVGERLGVGRSNTKMIVFRARQRLRSRIAAFSAAACSADDAAHGETVDAPERNSRAVA
ncbi:ECF RNA polymerase sigma factor SigE [Planctomycetes bacterium Poly30]|uniref:ECF RNA polymerase sigma factor SigE n=1 Tax=Saltatorellus ferox TaxID=2528018 RepID=A0A518EQD4_9BACT|nr:ECF RNA polymerase sigma factor SigE [Planctomycetes bacterium Poly30]